MWKNNIFLQKSAAILEGVEMRALPPVFKTLAVSPMAFSGSFTCSNTSVQVTILKTLSLNGSCSASPTTAIMFLFFSLSIS